MFSHRLLLVFPFEQLNHKYRHCSFPENVLNENRLLTYVPYGSNTKRVWFCFRELVLKKKMQFWNLLCLVECIPTQNVAPTVELLTTD